MVPAEAEDFDPVARGRPGAHMEAHHPARRDAHLGGIASIAGGSASAPSHAPVPLRAFSTLIAVGSLVPSAKGGVGEATPNAQVTASKAKPNRASRSPVPRPPSMPDGGRSHALATELQAVIGSTHEE